MNLDFDNFYTRRPESRQRTKQNAKKKKKVIKKKKKKKLVAKGWDDSNGNRDRYKLSQSQQLEKKLSTVSKHRHLAKDLVEEQKRKAYDKRRIEEEEKEIELERKQLVRRKQALLNKHPDSHSRRRFSAFTTTGESESEEESDSAEEDTDPSDDFREARSMKIKDNSAAEMTLQALTQKLSSLETELHTIKSSKANEQVNQTEETSPMKMQQTEHAHQRTMRAQPEQECIESHGSGGDITLNMDSINKTLNAAKQKKVGKTVHLQLPSMPSISSMPNMSQPPQLLSTAEVLQPTIAPFAPSPPNEEKAIDSALHSLDVPSLLMLLDKLKLYFKEVQTEKKENEEFRSTILSSVNAQNTQILHLLSQLASQQKEMDALKGTVSTLTDKLEKHEQPAMQQRAQWSKHTLPAPMMQMPAVPVPVPVPIASASMNEEVALKDIRNAIEESRPSQFRTQAMLNDTDWKSISNVLAPKQSAFECETVPVRPYTIQKHQRRSFLPTPTSTPPQHAIQQEQVQRVAPPQPVSKPKKSKKQHVKYIQQNVEPVQGFLNAQEAMNIGPDPGLGPRFRVERFHQ